MSDEQKELALRLYNDGYHAGHHDTVEGIFSDDIHGADAEYYHGEAVSEILREHEDQQDRQKGQGDMDTTKKQRGDGREPVPCPFCGGQACATKASCVRYVECIRCGASTRVFYGPSGETEAVEAWNMRKDIDK